MSYLVSDKMWSKYKHIVQNFIDRDAGLQEVIWLKHLQYPLPFGEDNDEDNYESIPLQALINYNSFRTWPLNVGTPSGELDEINCAMLVSQNQLVEKQLVNEKGYWNFDCVLDRFIINGETYISKGDSQVAQAKDTPIVFQVLLRRQEDGTDTAN